MSDYLFQSIVNGVGVAVGLFVLWSFTTRMPEQGRLIGALIAGCVAAVLTFAITTMIAGATS